MHGELHIWATKKNYYMRTVHLHFDSNNTLNIVGADYDNILAELFGISAHYYTIRIQQVDLKFLKGVLADRFPHKQLEKEETFFQLIRWLILISSSVQAFRNFLQKNRINFEFVSYRNQMAEVA